jgi:hypothetical protein
VQRAGSRTELEPSTFILISHCVWTRLIPCSELSELLPHLYRLLPLPAASSALDEVLSESIFKFGKGAKILTEPLLDWFTGSNFQIVLSNEDGGESSPKPRY